MNKAAMLQTRGEGSVLSPLRTLNKSVKSSKIPAKSDTLAVSYQRRLLTLLMSRSIFWNTHIFVSNSQRIQFEAFQYLLGSVFV